MDYAYRLRNPAEDLNVGAQFFLIAAHAKPPVFQALEVIERDGTSIWVKRITISALARVPDYSTAGSVCDGAEIKREGSR